MTDPFSAPADRPAEPWGPPPWAAKTSGNQSAADAFVPPPSPVSAAQPAPQPDGGQAQPGQAYPGQPYAGAGGATYPGQAYPAQAYAQGPYGPGYGVPLAGLRHPLDPDVRTSTKAGAVLVLGITAVLLMFCVGGLVPAILGLSLARQARRELAEAKGFLSGEGMLRAGTAMSWIALAMSLLILFGAAIVALISYGADSGPHFDPNVD